LLVVKGRTNIDNGKNKGNQQWEDNGKFRCCCTFLTDFLVLLFHSMFLFIYEYGFILH